MARTTGSPVCIHIGAEERVQGSSDLGRAQAPHPTTVVRAGEGTQQPNAGESCALQASRSAGKTSGSTGAWFHTLETRNENSFLLQHILQSPQLGEGKGKIFEGPDSFSQIRQQRMNLDLRGNSPKLAQVVDFCITNPKSCPTINIFI